MKYIDVRAQQHIRSEAKAASREGELVLRRFPWLSRLACPRNEAYIQFASQDSRPSGPNPWKVLALHIKRKCPGHPPLGRNVVQEIRLIRIGCSCLRMYALSSHLAVLVFEGRISSAGTRYRPSCDFVFCFLELLFERPTAQAFSLPCPKPQLHIPACSVPAFAR